MFRNMLPIASSCWEFSQRNDGSCDAIENGVQAVQINSTILLKLSAMGEESSDSGSFKQPDDIHN